MDQIELVNRLIDLLLDVEPSYCGEAARFPRDYNGRRYLLRCLMNIWDPRHDLPDEYYDLQDKLLTVETQVKRPVWPESLPESGEPGLYLWQGDITRLASDAIVNAANSQMLGCFVPGHNCIDNAIHSAAGLELRRVCYALMKAQGHEEPTGKAKITPAFNLPSKYVIHTVGPIVGKRVTPRDRQLLSSCYTSCLELAEHKHLQSIAFCCISTGVFHFPQQEAAEIAVKTVGYYRALHPESSIKRVIFNVFKDEDRDIYAKLLGIEEVERQD